MGLLQAKLTAYREGPSAVRSDANRAADRAQNVDGYISYV